MDEPDAIAMARRLAADNQVQLDPAPGLARGAAADPNSSYWAFVFSGPNCPKGWVWVINVNDRNEQPIIIAHNSSFLSK
jgi:hypothetical protein